MSNSTMIDAPSNFEADPGVPSPPPPKSDSYWIAFAFITLVASFLLTAALAIALSLFFRAGSVHEPDTTEEATATVDYVDDFVQESDTISIHDSAVAITD